MKPDPERPSGSGRGGGQFPPPTEEDFLEDEVSQTINGE